MRKFLIVALLLVGMKSYAEIKVDNAQALFIYNFMRHVKWPDNSVGDAYVIGVIGNSSTYAILKEYTKARKVGIKPIRVVQYKSIEEIRNCQVLLVATNKSSEISKVSTKLQNKGCLIIGEKSGLSKSGAVIDFRVVGNKLRFAINETNASKQNLVISRALVDMAI